VLRSFTGTDGDGKYPSSALVQGTDGALYGTTEWGGSQNLGAVFKLNTDGTAYTVLYSFGTTPSDGSYPHAPLVRASDGGLFGTTQFGGDNNFGTIFRIGPAPAMLSAVKQKPDKTIQISLNSAPHFAYRIEGSSDHLHWATLTNTFNATGTIQFTDTEAPNLSKRFYRAVWVP